MANDERTPADGQPETASDPAVVKVITGLLEKYARPGKPVTAETDIMGDLDIDSVAVLDVVMELEDHFDISVPLEVMPRVRTVGDLAREIQTIRVGA